MFRDRDRELARLEQALLEDGEDEEYEDDKNSYEEQQDGDCEEEYEEEYGEVRRSANGTSCLSVLALVLLTAIVFMLLLFTLKIKGII